MSEDKKYLPVGSVVMLKNGKKRCMIIGYFTTEGETKVKLYDYIGCFYPEGIYRLDVSLGFNHEDIKTVYYRGYSDQEFVSFNNMLKKFKKDNVDENGNLKATPKELLANVPK